MIVLIVAAVGYVVLIPIHHVERARLSRLVVTRPVSGFKVKPTSSSQLAAASSPFAEVKTAAKKSPNSTGSYSIQWAATSSSSAGASLLASLLPSGSDANAVQAEAAKSYLAAASFKSESFTSEARLSVPSVAGAEAATFAPTSSKVHEGLGVVEFRVDHIVVVVIVAQQSTPAAAGASAVSLANAEYEHLRQLGSGFSLTVTTWPLVASLIYGGVTLAIVAGLLLAPATVGRGRRRRVLAREEAARRELRGRGRKIAKHQAARRR
jgi:hypothetical protein